MRRRHDRFVCATGWTNYRFHLSLFALIGVYFLCAVGVKTLFTTPHELNIQVQAQDNLVSPLPSNPPVGPLEIGQPGQPQEGLTIDDYIKQVFGQDTAKAMTLLSCENPSHDPNAVNTLGNYPPGSRDIGVFQINEFWQGVNGKFLFNWKVNIEVAKQLFDENGGHFWGPQTTWTCGRKLGV